MSPGRPPGKSRNGKGSTFTREKISSGEVTHVVLLMERDDYATLQQLARQNERSASAQVRWIVRQWLAEQRKSTS